MLRFLALRAARALLTVLICVSAVFLALRLAGDPADIMLSIDTPPDVRAHYRELWGLERPLIEQYGRYLAAVAQGDFGLSFGDDRPAFEAVREAHHAPRGGAFGRDKNRDIAARGADRLLRRSRVSLRRFGGIGTGIT